MKWDLYEIALQHGMWPSSVKSDFERLVQELERGMKTHRANTALKGTVTKPEYLSIEEARDAPNHDGILKFNLLLRKAGLVPEQNTDMYSVFSVIMRENQGFADRFDELMYEHGVDPSAIQVKRSFEDITVEGTVRAYDGKLKADLMAKFKQKLEEKSLAGVIEDEKIKSRKIVKVEGPWGLLLEARSYIPILGYANEREEYGFDYSFKAKYSDGLNLLVGLDEIVEEERKGTIHEKYSIHEYEPKPL